MMDDFDSIVIELDKVKTSTNELTRAIDHIHGSFNKFNEAVQKSLSALDERVSKLEGKE